MKRLKFKKLNFDDAQILSREQLKHVLGGDGYGGGYGGGENAYLCGTRSYNGQCYCDICDNVTHFPIYCGVPCPVTPCRLP